MNEKLELKHLAPYLPYGLKYEYETVYGKINHAKRAKVIGLLGWGTPFTMSDELGILNVKPILRPLSDLLPSGCFVEIEDASQDEMNHAMWADLRWRLERCEKNNSNIDVVRMPYWVIRILLKYHFDVFGLIDQGLAIDINTLNKPTED